MSLIHLTSTLLSAAKVITLLILFAPDVDEDDIQEKLSRYFGDGNSSGSDFETEMKKDKKVKKQEESPSSSSSSPSSSSGEDENEEERRRSELLFSRKFL